MKSVTLAVIDDLYTRYPKLAICRDALASAVERTAACYRNGGKLLACGNGGSAADSLHIVGELMKEFALLRPLDDCSRRILCEAGIDDGAYMAQNLQMALPSIALVNEVSLMTAYANDQAADLVFAQQVFGLGNPGDVLVAISTSGNSGNILYAAQTAKAKGMTVIGLTGQSGGKLAKWADVLLAVPETETYQIQELHLPIYHAFCQALEAEFFGGEA